MNTFVSTSRKRNVALVFASNGSHKSLLESVFFKITINKNVATKTKPFVDITNMRILGEEEKEILLSMGIVFKIESVEPLVENGIVWQVNLILTESVVDNEIDILFDYFKANSTTKNDRLFGNLYHNIGSLYHENNDNEKALKYLTKASKICQNNSTLPSVLLCAILYTDMSGIYEDNEEFDKALDMLQRTLEIQLRVLPSTHFRIAATYHNIDGIYLCKDDYEIGLENFETALDIGLKPLPSDHENIQTYYEHIQLAKERIK
ncbi:unnamed protein product [Rotaria magnacalcarata]|uniref:Uncharacterized protein n=1 Tax=Rotaria magnacalcarata TaxID=392030 RepID=A0A815RCW8_9BILA|nr:unnamed protein product [Rotaria magnacalcarata]CAF4071448.1 unnamed protein product [Rotaria magnacalcarata]